MHKRKFYAAKVNIHGNIFSTNVEELIEKHIPRVILESKPLKINTWNWTFTDVSSIKLYDQDLIIGNVTKSKRAKQKIRIGQKTEKVQTEHELAHTAFFVYDPIGEVLAHESTSRISGDEFRELFTKLLSQDPYVGEVKIKPFPVPQKIRSEIRAIENITKIRFNLIHPNYGREEFNLYQDIIRENGLKELDIEMGNEDGFNVVDEMSELGEYKFKKTIENGITLVESGYGEIEVKGFDKKIVQGKKKPRIQKKKRMFSSKNSIQQININETVEKRLIDKVFTFILNVKNKYKGDK